MTQLVAALPMYDWPETRAETDSRWATLRDRLRAAGIAAPQRLTRRNADLPGVPGGIRDAAGEPVAPDPASLPPEALDMAVVWRHPALLLAQTCWGPMETTGLDSAVTVVGQPDYSAFEGGVGPRYSSVIVARRGAAEAVAAPVSGEACLPVDFMRGRRLAFNEAHSMSGRLAPLRDLAAIGLGEAIFAERIETGAHRASILAVAEGRADVAAIDCRTWALALRFEPAARALAPIGWTARRMGLPYVSASGLGALHPILREVLEATGEARVVR